MSVRLIMRHTVVVGTVLTLSGCNVGTDIRSVAPANSPNGVQTSLQLAGRPARINGELVAVRDTEFIILTSLGYTSVAYDLVGSAEFKSAPGVGRWKNTTEKRSRLAMFSRYPFGLDDGTLSAILGMADQNELIVIHD